ncbi:phosphatidylinositol N-acetylglucosaminyltransferase [Laetiporus sulphureus 93-53]|uniref:Phosphatidylinositol N-acetylglucosaminyltransferase n=1 Tax=Laetiporus sulphureus 93-53 TaxID=1314785 RepID=A0A165CFT5_9APHY|nr:phosphatidylinositol N-acetylglucosaminyltransferase [Laetiporus sulphureus 93-53]KZT02733.1 phosphatidylinositol N-acetylglucosaminyltransferase [Laetiporus sulphureus 93-53]
MTEAAWEAEWDRVLWKKKSYPDNYVPKSFLSSLSRNSNFVPYTYWYLVRASCAISQHLATIFIFLAVFIQLNESRLDARVLIWMSIGAFITGYALWELVDCRSDSKTSTGANHAKAMKSSILVFLALMALSPVLRTLTAATSSDSIWALSAGLFVLSALLADYTPLRAYIHHQERLTSVLSMNAAISSAVVLASRLPDDQSVFALMLFSVQLFALFPILRRRLQTGPGFLQGFVTLSLCGSSVRLAASVSRIGTCLVFISLSFVMFVGPGVLIWAQKYKNEIRGTWDPAVPVLNKPDRFGVTP